jgi:exonuclease III
MVCVYAPVTRKAFFTDVLPACLPAPASRLLVLGGIGTVYCSREDVVRHHTQGGELGSRGHRDAQLQASMHTQHLTDVWRALQPAASNITHFHTAGAGQGSGARLDRWLLLDSMLPWVWQTMLIYVELHSISVSSVHENMQQMNGTKFILKFTVGIA